MWDLQSHHHTSNGQAIRTACGLQIRKTIGRTFLYRGLQIHGNIEACHSKCRMNLLGSLDMSEELSTFAVDIVARRVCALFCVFCEPLFRRAACLFTSSFKQVLFLLHRSTFAFYLVVLPSSYTTIRPSRPAKDCRLLTFLNKPAICKNNQHYILHIVRDTT